MEKLEKLKQRIIRCKKCPRLVSFRETVAKNKVRRFKDETYWGRPLPGFGDSNAQILIVGLAPAAHGGNRTGRMFTGDSSADWLAKVLHENGFATKPESRRIGDGFKLMNTYITATVRCAPPQNKPTRQEFENCSVYLKTEISILKNLQVIVCLGKTAFELVCNILQIKNPKFFHGKVIVHQNFVIIASYHPSRQNTQTGRLKWDQWNSIFVKARSCLNKKTEDKNCIQNYNLFN